jgi:hypothetical protein
MACVESSWNLMAHGDTWEGKGRGKWQMEWVASTLHTTSEHGVSSITTADAHTSAASSQLNWRPRLFKWTHLFHRKTKSGFCACAITFQMQSTICYFSSMLCLPCIIFYPLLCVLSCNFNTCSIILCVTSIPCCMCCVTFIPPLVFVCALLYVIFIPYLFTSFYFYL